MEYDLLLCLDWNDGPRAYDDFLVHGLSWIGLAASITPWLCAMVSNLQAMLDTKLWRDDTTDCEIWVGHRHGFWKYVM
ncbi:hypothetical protein TIFTF001_035573 [Ficus carica]|uniref:Uncharacterized protein n=1 Tax=Ficus carica TaxID=3494 RepID=A0AA88E2H7_FICCA|nr:hypothetical protein TIFTF001_035548 [Ficus carica]GMN66488.1 hypothetical protein TIFTF001_035553 [Ficus carica]GMN66496.1 hypothetical protein TIFTF001_035567 [Ficus carica]GMN66508.1 hypothetical protein TIFTF001_035573 [Ficus carica]